MESENWGAFGSVDCTSAGTVEVALGLEREEVSDGPLKKAFLRNLRIGIVGGRAKT